MAGRKLLIADPNEDFRLALAKTLGPHYDVSCCATGTEARARLLRKDFSFLVLDLMLPQLDGLTLLEQLAAQNIRPRILLVSSMVTEYVLHSADRLGIGYAMLKPCQVPVVAARILDMDAIPAPPAAVSRPERIASELLLSLQFPTNLKGFPELKTALILLEQDPDQLITKVLYPEVTKQLHRDSGQVERNIRHAISTTWKRRNAEVWNYYFPNAVKRPSNAVFLRRLAEELHQSLLE